MSLINQVLKDLEQRHAEQLVEATHSLDGLAFAPEIGRAPVRRRKWPYFVALLGLFAVGLAAYGYWHSPWPQESAAIAPAQSVPEPARVPPQREAPPAQLSVANAPPAATQAEPAVEAAVQTPAVPAVRETTDVTPVTRSALPVKPVAVRESPAGAGVAKQMVPLTPEQKAELSYQSGYKYLQENQHRRAEQELREALRSEAGHIKARELLAGLLIKQGRWIEASEILQRGIQIAPHQRSFVTLQARTLMQLERDQQAIALLRDFAPPMHEDPEHYALLAALYQRQNDHPSAVNTYGQLLKLRPAVGIWWVGLGISLEALGKHTEARQAYREARQSGTLHGNIARYTDNRLLALEAIRYPAE